MSTVPCTLVEWCVAAALLILLLKLRLPLLLVLTHTLTCSNQFLNQEPGSNDVIKQFAQEKGFKGFLMDKIDVNGSEASPVYTYLKVLLLKALLAAV